MKYLIAIPCMDMVHTAFLKSLLSLDKPEGTRFGLTCSSLIYDARNQLARKAIDEGFDRVLWLDSDMEFEPDFMKRLAEDMDTGKEFVSGLYFKRKTPIQPVVYKEVGYYKNEDSVTPIAVSYEDYPLNEVFRCAAAGFGGVMVSVDLIKRVQDKFGLPFSPILGFGEDLSFCKRAEDLGATLWCDSRLKMGHIGMASVTESVYLSNRGV